jgi:anti-sigma regulatory factor (Ser/Thr protein kinase)
LSAKPRSDGGADIGRDHSHRLVVQNSFSELDRASEWVRGFAHERKLPRQLAFGLELCVNEALTNIISYAYADSRAHQIELRLWREHESIRLRLKDDGQPFNPVEATPPEQAQTLEAARARGMGISLMRHFVDDMQYARRDGRNILTMVLHWQEPASRDAVE